jgi:hypothetical protein
MRGDRVARLPLATLLVSLAQDIVCGVVDRPRRAAARCQHACWYLRDCCRAVDVGKDNSDAPDGRPRREGWRGINSECARDDHVAVCWCAMLTSSTLSSLLSHLFCLPSLGFLTFSSSRFSSCVSLHCDSSSLLSCLTFLLSRIPSLTTLAFFFLFSSHFSGFHSLASHHSDLCFLVS